MLNSINMFKILTIIGTRPQIIKSNLLSEELKKNNNLQEIIIDTGQHYDYELSKIFFKEMKINLPHYTLNVGSGTHTKQLSQMMSKIEPIFEKERPDLVLVYGDTNSTLSGALVGRRKNIQIIHIEAGLRSYNKDMPEEVNRIITDHISDYLFVPTETAKLSMLVRALL